MKRSLQVIWRVVKNKFVLTTAIFFVWLLVFDQHNLVDRFKARKHLNQLKQDTLYYSDKIEEDRQSIHLLETSPDNLERFARERYLMKRADEDIFIILK